MALHEYYLDRFSAKLLGVPGEEASSTQKRDEDQWTLEYLGPYSQEICEAIDRDLSGYIRISEVNAFTNEIPEGWTFPQWCVYQGIGERHFISFIHLGGLGLITYQAGITNNKFTRSVYSTCWTPSTSYFPMVCHT